MLNDRKNKDKLEVKKPEGDRMKKEQKAKEWKAKWGRIKES